MAAAAAGIAGIVCATPLVIRLKPLVWGAGTRRTRFGAGGGRCCRRGAGWDILFLLYMYLACNVHGWPTLPQRTILLYRAVQCW